jgi:hypothetical protein
MEERLKYPKSDFLVTQNVGVTPAEACRKIVPCREWKNPSMAFKCFILLSPLQ